MRSAHRRRSSRVDAQLGEDQIIAWTCNPALTNFTLTKLLWVRKHEPTLFERFRTLLLPKDYVRYRLTGEYGMDMADASGTLLLDVANRRWSTEMARATGIDPSLPPAALRIARCLRTNLRIRSSGNRPAEGNSCRRRRRRSSRGRSRTRHRQSWRGTRHHRHLRRRLCRHRSPALDPKGRLHTFCHAIPGRWHVMGVTQSAGLSLRWFRDNFGTLAEDSRDPYEHLSEEAAAVPPGCDGVLWAPYLMGERTPHLDPQARAALVGLAANHGRGHIIRAILEGVAFSLRDSFSIFAEMKVPVTDIRLGGGGARSLLWRQIQADVYGHSVEVVAAEEGAAYGAALLAGVGARTWSSVDEACQRTVRIAKQVDPDPATSALMNHQYEMYRRVYPALRQIQRNSDLAQPS